jgi:hypothetical protein
MNYPLMYPDYSFAIVIYIVLENKGKETYRKKLSENPLRLTASHCWESYSGIEDYGLKASIT